MNAITTDELIVEAARLEALPVPDREHQIALALNAMYYRGSAHGIEALHTAMTAAKVGAEDALRAAEEAK